MQLPLVFGHCCMSSLVVLGMSLQPLEPLYCSLDHLKIFISTAYIACLLNLSLACLCKLIHELSFSLLKPTRKFAV